ncbi:DUF4468 domain-containing protein [Parabacteroides sp. PF5-6]|uniref:DUF4468 domain-containing protein n=1 Tax=Parabacteroides sp. PF5-6 TaxID=1742403 RepID=UPI002406F7D5|nr:DUF4468 domain-containing protein [Parabacteroides sp. PF5-6]MDF9830829.1 hypothetical protein [Parabacteroides sp. PF5-6]
MKHRIFLLCLLLPAWLAAQGQGKTTCSPVKNGKICYNDEVEAATYTKDRLFESISKWATNAYGTDIFFSNVSANKNRGTILVSSKVELLLSETEKTFVKFRLRICCYDKRYTAEMTDIVYQYDPYNDKRVKTYPAENVILNEGKGNTVALIQDPRLFCEATHDFAEKLLGEIFDATKKR